MFDDVEAAAFFPHIDLRPVQVLIPVHFVEVGEIVLGSSSVEPGEWLLCHGSNAWFVSADAVNPVLSR